MPGGQEMPDRAPCLARALEPFGGPHLERLLACPVPGPQLSVQRLAHQMVVPEAGRLVIKRDQEQVGRVNSVQQRRRVLPRGDGCTRVRGQLLQDGDVEHELRDLRWLLIENFRDEVFGERTAADLQRPGGPRRVVGAAQGQRRHLQRRGPPLSALMKQRKLVGTDLDAEVGQQIAALGQGKIQVSVAELAQLARYPQPVQPQRRVNPAGQYQLGGPGGPPLDKIRHRPGDPGRRGVEVVDHDRRPGGQLRSVVRNRRGDIG